MSTDNDHRTGWATRSRLMRGGIGAAGVAAAMLSAAAVATATPQHSTQPDPAAATTAYSAATPYSTVRVTPVTVSSGAKVTVTGNGPKNARAGVWITFQSDAFVSKTSVNGIPAIRTQVLVNGKYSVKATIRRGLKPTTYAIAGSFNGKPLAQVAWIKVS
jgi:hypothetical protein